VLHRFFAALFALLVLAPRADAKRSGDGLLHILTPEPNAIASAHPQVNVIVQFGATADGATADATTFRAKLNGTDVTGRFTPLAEGEIPGVRAAFDDTVVRIGATNKLRLRVRAEAVGFGKRARRVKGRARVRFTVEERANKPPVARANADSELLLAGVPIHFDATASSDPELDPLTWSWDFGDGGTATGPVADHTYASDAVDVLATVTVSDGTADATASVPLIAGPSVDPDRTKGLLAISTDGPLELGGVATGQEATHTLTITNADATPTSQLIVRASVSAGAFSIEPATLDLGPSASGTLTLHFAPTAPGHADAVLSLVASATNRAAISILAHGFGGAAPGSGPTLAVRTVFYSGPDQTLPGDAVYGIRPDGTRFFAGSTVHPCKVSGGRPGNGDACVVNADCAPVGGTCDESATILFDAQALCADPEGNLMILGADGTVTDPDPNTLTERSSALLRVSLDDQGVPVEKRLLARVTGDTSELACDQQSLANKGQVYVSQYFDVDDDRCLRTEREALTSFRKDNGGSEVLKPRLDSIEGVDGCNDLEDGTAGLATTGAGDPLFVGFDLGGIWRYDDQNGHRAVVSGFSSPDDLAVHPDGALMFATATKNGTRTTVSLYKISAARVAAGPVSFAALTPCASHSIPDNGGRLFVLSLAVAPSADDSSTAVALAALRGSNETQGEVLPPALAPQGTLAFTVPSGAADTCSAVGLVTLDALNLLSF